MFEIRYYDKQFHPDLFRGPRGMVIRALNFVRWRLELLVTNLVVRYLARDNQVPKGEVGRLLKAFAIDVAAEKIEKEVTSPDSPVHPTSLLSADTTVSRYLQGRQQNALESFRTSEDELPLRPQPIAELAARHDPATRSRRYGKGRTRWVMAAEDEDFIPVPSEKTNGPG